MVSVVKKKVWAPRARMGHTDPTRKHQHFYAIWIKALLVAKKNITTLD